METPNNEITLLYIQVLKHNLDQGSCIIVKLKVCASDSQFVNVHLLMLVSPKNNFGS